MTQGSALYGYFLRLGAVGFGGPVALLARMERELVEERRWFSADEFRDGVALAQLAPGPLAAQLAMYLGWLRGGVLGSALTAIAFVLPSFVIVAGIAVFYVAAGGAPWLRAAFFGVGAAVVAILVRSAVRLLQRTTERDPALWAIAIGNGILVAATGREIVTVLFVTGALPALWMLVRRIPPSAASALLAVEPRQLGELFAFFAKSSLVVFGSGLAIIPFLRSEVVEGRGWLTEPQFLDAIAVAMITPGPVVITVAFIGWIVAGPLGGLAAALGVFAPTWLMVVVGAPMFERVRDSQAVRRLVAGITAAATGGLAGAVVVIGAGTITTWAAGAIGVAALLLIARFPKLPEPALLLAAGLVGLLAAPLS